MSEVLESPVNCLKLWLMRYGIITITSGKQSLWGVNMKESKDYQFTLLSPIDCWGL